MNDKSKKFIQNYVPSRLLFHIIRYTYSDSKVSQQLLIKPVHTSAVKNP